MWADHGHKLRLGFLLYVWEESHGEEKRLDRRKRLKQPH